MNNQYVIGVDFGSDSVRAVVINAKNGTEEASAVEYYPRWKQGLYCNPIKKQYRQHPLDYIESLESVIKKMLRQCSSEIADDVCGISFDTTCSTPVITDINGTALALLPHHNQNPNAMFILWKDHTAIYEADQINSLSHSWTTDYTKYEGGIYSCEWAWAKVLHCLREDNSIRSEAYSWIEHCDWIGAMLTDNLQPEKVFRSRSAAGHKAMWHESWGGLPSQEFLSALDPLLHGMRAHLYNNTYTTDTRVGGLCGEWAQRLGLKEGIAVGIGSIDCHVGAVGAEISPNILVKTIGTSTCDIIMTDYDSVENTIVKGICGQVDGSVTPGYVGFEAGQSAFGDIYAWFKKLICWTLKNLDVETKALIEDKIIEELSHQASLIDYRQSTPLSIDWMNGRRTPDANPHAQGAICNLTLSSSAPEIFLSLVQATAFGSRAINERLIEQGIKIDGIIALGGIACKSPLVMQTMSDVIGMPIKIAKNEQTCAFGAAMFAAVASGIHPTIFYAQRQMGQGFAKEYIPDPVRHEHYNKIYTKYRELGTFINAM